MSITLEGPCHTEVLCTEGNVSVLLAVDWQTGVSCLITVWSCDGSMWLDNVQPGLMFNTEKMI